MAMHESEAHRKMKKVMHEFKKGKLKSSSGGKVKSRKQAIAIGMSESGMSKKKKGKKGKKSKLPESKAMKFYMDEHYRKAMK